MVLLFLLLRGLGHVLQAHGLSLASGHGRQTALLLTLATLIGLAAVGLYNREHLARLHDVVARAIVVLPMILAAALVVLGGGDWLHPETAHRGTYVMVTAGLSIFYPLLILLRALFIRTIDRFDALKHRVAVLGDGARAANIERLSRTLCDRTFTVTGIVHLGSDPELSSCKSKREHWLAPDALDDFCRLHQVDELVVAVADRRGLPLRELLACRLRGVAVTDYASFWERESGQVDLDAVTPGWLVFSDGFRAGLVRNAAKRVLDVVLSLLLLLVTLPVTLVTALLIRLESPGSIFYLQERVGQRGRPFFIMKFRSMREDAEKDGPRWAAKNDARVTRIGAVIRKVRIDEIPQAINVLKGEMSFVGPRPERPVFVEALAQIIPYYGDRHAAKPGITGWAQINYPYGATTADARNKLAFDLYYVKNASLFLDLIIMVQTVKVLLWSEGAR